MRLDRRDFLRATALALGASTAMGCRVMAADEEDDACFPQSVASGDPRPGSVVLWTRVVVAGRTRGDISLDLELSTREDLAEPWLFRAAVVARARYDHCAKVKITGLSPATTYYYRFVLFRGDGRVASRTGRTRTAPAEGADVEVRFAFASCQEYSDRYYNAYIAMAREDIDFVVHLGDYVYEVVGAAAPGAQRSVDLPAPERAIAVTDRLRAANTLEQYRELYRTYRSDRHLQRVHERFPMVAIWDDHELSDDCYGATGTYFDGRVDETDVRRRKAANQAWYEYQPVDYPGVEGFAYDPAAPYPHDIRIHRDLVFGKHVHLVMTDLRTFRAAHLIPGDALPGAVAVDEAALIEALGAVPDDAGPYIDVATYAGGVYRPALAAAALFLGMDPAKVRGALSVAFVNAVLARLRERAPDPVPLPPIIDEEAQALLPRGYAFSDLGKQDLHSPVGSRYLVAKGPFELYASMLHRATGGESERVMGEAQRAWFLETIERSGATWKVWGNGYALSQLVIDLRALPVPEPARRRLYLSADGWDGFPNMRRDLLERMARAGNVVAITGDLHGFVAATPGGGEPSGGIVEFVGGAISTLPVGLTARAAVLPSVPGADRLPDLDDLLMTGENPDLRFVDARSNGYVVVSASGSELRATMRLIDSAEVDADFTGREQELLARVRTVELRILPGKSEIHRRWAGEWRRWDRATSSWVAI